MKPLWRTLTIIGVLEVLMVLCLFLAVLRLSRIERCQGLLETAVAAQVHNLPIGAGPLLDDWETACP